MKPFQKLANLFLKAIQAVFKYFAVCAGKYLPGI
jgi:hypothetical protein